nr:murein biosynthesis integral membrane protein MurJ [Thiohalomonas denitrificans]
MSRSLLKSTAVVGGFTLISRVLGFVRDVAFATVFGAGAGTDAFFVAFKIPNFMRRLFAEGAFSQSFVPVLSEYKSRFGQEAVRELIASVAGVLGLVLLALTLLAMLGSSLVVGIFAPGFLDEPEKFALAAEMLRITFPYLLFISLTALAGGILNSYGRFAIPAVTPVWLNIIFIVAAYWGVQFFAPPVMALAWAVFAAGVVQLLFQLPALARLGLLPRPRLNWRHEGVRRILRLMGPAVFGSSVAQINLLLDTVIASFLVTGSVSWLYYSDRLVEFPLGVFGIALATVILPSLSSKNAEADREAFGEMLDWAVRWVLLIGLPAAVGLALLAGPILATLFQHGEFLVEDVRMARLSLMAYAVGLVGFMLVKVLAPGFFARQDTRTPVGIGVKAMFANMGMNILFVVPMVFAGLPGPHAGLALATACAAFLNAGMLWRRLRQDGIYRALPEWGRFGLQLLLANGLLAAFLLWTTPPLGEWIAWDVWRRSSQLALLIGAGALLYITALLAAGVRPKQLLGRH